MSLGCFQCAPFSRRFVVFSLDVEGLKGFHGSSQVVLMKFMVSTGDEFPATFMSSTVVFMVGLPCFHGVFLLS